MVIRRLFTVLIQLAVLCVSCQKLEAPAVEQNSEATANQQPEDVSSFTFKSVEINDVDFSAKGYKYLTGIREMKHYDTAEDFYTRVTTSIASGIEDLGLSQDNFNTIANVVYAKDLHDLTARMFINSGNGAKGRFEEYIIEYNSTSAAGEPITLSGVVVFPNYQTDGIFVHTIDNISLIHDHLKAYDECVSEQGSIDYLRAIYNQAVVMSDFEGYNHNVERTVHPYVSYNALARQSIDCALAALELIDYVGLRMKPAYKVYNMGMSKGGGTAMATQKMLENSEPFEVSRKLNLAGTYCATSVIDFRGLIKHFNDKKIKGESTADEDLMISWMAATALYFAYHTHQSVISETDFENFFTAEFNSFAKDEKLFGNPKMYWGSYQRLFSQYNMISLDKVLNERFFIQEGDNKGELNEDDELVKKIFAVLDEENPANGWSPKSPLLMEHSKDDEKSNYEVSFKNYCRLKYQPMFTNPYVNFNTYHGLEHDVLSGVALVRMAVLEEPYKPVLYNLF